MLELPLLPAVIGLLLIAVAAGIGGLVIGRRLGYKEMLGHSSIVVTMDRYGHLFETLQDELAEKQQHLYGG